MASCGLKLCTYKFGDHDRQEVAVWEIEEPNPRGYWLVYIHGGAWRSVDQTWGDFTASIQCMVADDFEAKSCIRGFMSLDYRLSGQTEMQSVQHPEHVNDVSAGLSLLKDKYSLTDNNYVLIGHSAGATLAFQLLMGEMSTGMDKPPLPAAIVGVSGVYDLVNINNRFNNSYSGYFLDAFGANKTSWDTASPAQWKGKFVDAWPGRKAIILCNSSQDPLVDIADLDSMLLRLRQAGIDVREARTLTGGHDSIWKDGTQIAKVLGELLQSLPNITN